jgi:hypothetical protein
LGRWIVELIPFGKTTLPSAQLTALFPCCLDIFLLFSTKRLFHMIANF